MRAAPGGVLSAEPEDEPAAPTTKRPPKKPLAAGERIEISLGTLIAGSAPGDRGRQPGLEPNLLRVSLGAFSIDRLPYPNDPAQPPLTDVTRAQAAKLCAERGQRLCTELEWERACKGPDNDAYPTGNGWDPACEQTPQSCASGFDVASLGATMREWTSSNVATEPAEDAKLGVLRGARSKVAHVDHRCARREPADPGAHGPDIGFRCCSGPVNAASVPAPKLLPPFQRVQLDAEQVTAMIRSVPQLSHLGKVTFFRDPEDVDAVMAKGDAGKEGNLLTTRPLVWSPEPGEEILVIAARGEAGSSFVAAFHKLPEDRYRLASSFVFKNETVPIVLAFNSWATSRLRWSTCWGCLGEEGAVIYRKDGHVVIEQL